MIALRIIGIILLIIFAFIGFALYCCLVVGKRADERMSPPCNWCGEEALSLPILCYTCKDGGDCKARHMIGNVQICKSYKPSGRCTFDEGGE